jgi:hypothetical protein
MDCVCWMRGHKLANFPKGCFCRRCYRVEGVDFRERTSAIGRFVKRLWQRWQLPTKLDPRAESLNQNGSGGRLVAQVARLQFTTQAGLTRDETLEALRALTWTWVVHNRLAGLSLGDACRA